jgi:hypothetical protein
MKTWGVGLAFLLCACTINGKSYGPGSSSKSASSDASPSSSSSSGGGGGERKPYNSNDGLAAYPSAPADPWIAVQGDQPKRWPAEAAEHWKVRSDDHDCSAKADHCLQKDAWFIVKDRDVERYMPTTAGWAVFNDKFEIVNAWNGRGVSAHIDEKITAFRTVPATKTNIKPGTAVIALGRDVGKLGSEAHSYNSTWYYGFVEEVDTDGGFFTIKNKDDSFKLWGARVIVLSWKRPGGKVEMVNGFQKTNMAVKASDVYLPE